MRRERPFDVVGSTSVSGQNPPLARSSELFTHGLNERQVYGEQLEARIASIEPLAVAQEIIAKHLGCHQLTQDICSLPALDFGRVTSVLNGPLDVFRADQATMFDTGLSAFERKLDMTDVG